jgi:alpha-ketoglutarate-dependent taurine dioxygenase
MGLLLDELVTYYRGFCNGQAVKLPALGVQYADYATWQREWMSGTVQARQLAYWKKQLQDAPSLLKVPLDHPRREVEQFRGATVYFKLPAPLTQRLKEVSREQNITLYMLLLSAYQILLYRISGQRDILVGTPVAGRNKAETEDLIGFFVNTLVMRTHFSGRETFKELLLQVRKTALEAYANQDLPFEKLVEALQPERSLSYSPIFQVMFTFFNEPTRRKLRDTGFEWSALEIDRGLSNRDLTLRMEELDNVLVGHLEYNVDLFENSTIRRFIAQFERLLVQLMEHPDDRIANLDLLSEEEKQAITKAGQTQEKSSRDKFKQFLGKRPGGLNLSQPELVKIGSLSPDMTFPLLVQPRVTEVSLVTWAEKNLEFIQTNLDKYGAILWRNFPVSGPTEFEQFARIIAPELLDYMERSTPRNLVEGKVFTSTSYPPDQYIMLHNEVSYSHCWPIKLWFYCQHAPSQGGATPLADSRLVYQRLDPALKEKFISKRVMYVRNYGDGLDLPWQEVYQTNHPAEVEKYCRDAGIEFEWKSGNRLRTRQVRQAVAQHPRTGEMVWFNSVHMFHVAAHTPEVRDSLLAIFAPEDLPRNVYFGDGTPIENDEIAHIRQTYRECTISFPWQTGDVMLVDNMLLAHGRTPFSGERKVLVAMAEPYSQ